ncbi:methyltransferase [Microbacterium sp. NPDC019599]|uniref:methyltransferase n=1 Tax=Microbacterium sp. NPDC019599 TaxID=3154690 RepID=UPI0033C0409C
MSETQTRRLWVAYGPAGAVGSIEKSAEDAFTVKMVGADAPVGTYPALEVAKSALVSHLKPGSDRPEFREH